MATLSRQQAEEVQNFFLSISEGILSGGGDPLSLPADGQSLLSALTDEERAALAALDEQAGTAFALDPEALFSIALPAPEAGHGSAAEQATALLPSSDEGDQASPEPAEAARTDVAEDEGEGSEVSESVADPQAGGTAERESEALDELDGSVAVDLAAATQAIDSEADGLDLDYSLDTPTEPAPQVYGASATVEADAEWATDSGMAEDTESACVSEFADESELAEQPERATESGPVEEPELGDELHLSAGREITEELELAAESGFAAEPEASVEPEFAAELELATEPAFDTQAEVGPEHGLPDHDTGGEAHDADSRDEVTDELPVQLADDVEMSTAEEVAGEVTARSDAGEQTAELAEDYSHSAVDGDATLDIVSSLDESPSVSLDGDAQAGQFQNADVVTAESGEPDAGAGLESALGLGFGEQQQPDPADVSAWQAQFDGPGSSFESSDAAADTTHAIMDAASSQPHVAEGELVDAEPAPSDDIDWVCTVELTEADDASAGTAEVEASEDLVSSWLAAETGPSDQDGGGFAVDGHGAAGHGQAQAGEQELGSQAPAGDDPGEPDAASALASEVVDAVTEDAEEDSAGLEQGDAEPATSSYAWDAAEQRDDGDAIDDASAVESGFEIDAVSAAARDASALMAEVDTDAVPAPTQSADMFESMRRLVAADLGTQLRDLYMPQIEGERELRVRAEQRVRELELDLREHGETLGVLRTELDHLGARNANMELMLEEARAELRSLRDSQRLQDAQSQELQANLHEARNRAADAVQRESAMRSQLVLEQEVLAKATREVESLRIEMGKLLQQRQQDAELMIAREAELKDLRLDALKQAEELDQARAYSAELAAERDRLAARADDLAAEQASSGAAADNLRMELDHARAEIEGLRAAVATLAPAPAVARRADGFLQGLPEEPRPAPVAAPAVALATNAETSLVVTPAAATEPAVTVEVSAASPVPTADEFERERKRLEVLAMPLEQVPAKLYFQAIPWTGLPKQAAVSIASQGLGEDDERALGSFAAAMATQQAIDSSQR